MALPRRVVLGMCRRLSVCLVYLHGGRLVWRVLMGVTNGSASPIEVTRYLLSYTR